jgi:hypothetical protein
LAAPNTKFSSLLLPFLQRAFLLDEGSDFIKGLHVGQAKACLKRLGAACAINMRAACGMGIKNNIDVRLWVLWKKAQEMRFQ